MSESGSTADARKGRLANAVREVKNREADREDVVVELREAARARLELLAAELEPIFAEVPAGMDLFDFAISSGLQPRLWIDAVAHVGFARDARTFQFVRDTRSGRETIAESAAVAAIVDAVTNYIAERIVERERALSGIAPSASGNVSPAPDLADTSGETSRGGGFFSALMVLLFGALFGLGLAATLFWDRIFPAGLGAFFQ